MNSNRGSDPLTVQPLTILINLSLSKNKSINLYRTRPKKRLNKSLSTGGMKIMAKKLGYWEKTTWISELNHARRSLMQGENLLKKKNASSRDVETGIKLLMEGLHQFNDLAQKILVLEGMYLDDFKSSEGRFASFLRSNPKAKEEISGFFSVLEKDLGRIFKEYGTLVRMEREDKQML